MKKRYQIKFGDQNLEVEVNDWMKRSQGSVLVKCGETIVLGTIVVGERDAFHLDYLPLTIEYEERFYAAGKIGGSRFIRRETRPSQEAVLTARLIDRSLRPLFFKNFRKEIQIVLLVTSIGEIDPDVCSLLASSLLVGIAQIPWQGPVAGGRVVKTREGIKCLPSFKERESALIDGFFSSHQGKINMMELKSKEANEEEIFDLIEKTLPEIEKLNQFQKEILKDLNLEEKKQELIFEASENFKNEVFNFLNKKKLEKAFFSSSLESFLTLKKEFSEFLSKKEFSEKDLSLGSYLFEKKLTEFLKEKILKEKIRPDLRKLDEIREMKAEVGLFPKVHGSALFCRGLTHSLSTTTLASPSSSLMIETIEMVGEERFIHHYNFLPFSCGEIGSLRKPPSRREIGHGNLVRNALEPIIPKEEAFPYTIRVVSEILSSNGSTSMASCCSSSLALADAGVPLKDYVAGVAMGLIIEDENNYQILTDIQGPEDHYGSMDLKIAGTSKGITAVQMDIKLPHLELKVLKEAFLKAKEARQKILKVLRTALASPRKEISPLAPKIIRIVIPQNKIGLLIGPGGRTIQDLIQAYQLEGIDVQKEGIVYVSGFNENLVKKAAQIISYLTYDYQENEIVEGKVARLLDYGALIELDPFHTGLLHISEISHRRVNRVSQVLKEGQKVRAKIIRIEPDGRIFLSLKALSRPPYKKRFPKHK